MAETYDAIRVAEIALWSYSMEAYNKYSTNPTGPMLKVDTQWDCSSYSMLTPESDSMATCKEGLFAGAEESLSQLRRLPG
jgi:hypothetical protein